MKYECFQDQNDPVNQKNEYRIPPGFDTWEFAEGLVFHTHPRDIGCLHIAVSQTPAAEYARGRLQT